MITVFDDGTLEIETTDQKKGHTYESIGAFFRALQKHQRFLKATQAGQIFFYVDTRHLSNLFVINNLESAMKAIVPLNCWISI